MNHDVYAALKTVLLRGIMDANVLRLEIRISFEAHFGQTPVFFNATPFCVACRNVAARCDLSDVLRQDLIARCQETRGRGEIEVSEQQPFLAVGLEGEHGAIRIHNRRSRRRTAARIVHGREVGALAIDDLPRLR